jgi:hypothetical protein
MTTHDTITRKEIGQLCPSLTYGAIRNRESTLGLIGCRINGFQRPILYKRSKVILVLVKAGLLSI